MTANLKILLLPLFFLSCHLVFAQQSAIVKTIIIDAGHGGKDVGAVGKFSKEKDVALAISLKLAKKLESDLDKIKIVLTRTKDVYQHPVEKANIANKSKGDLFISIHCNSAAPTTRKKLLRYQTQTVTVKKSNKTVKQKKRVPVYKTETIPNPASGTETYIWGVKKNTAKEKAMKENEALYLDKKLAEQVKDFDPDSPEKMILYNLKTKQYFSRSANLATNVEKEFARIGRTSRSAKQREVGIWVLQATAMPSILIEVGYISNPKEEKYLNSESGRNEIVSAISKAVVKYVKDLNSK